ncbi:hypothetical protein B0J11DRAFT_271777 [Dendryphion nanum]|uniref:Uncharacterized protein n=1 Tax=Dendryphion nanum TaxID=256645 RepID=A0A9P9DZU1_9PLEO|nr:hypothetical protein B0J11DRAFT_271777 [Dendryphion nanum]
MQSKSIARQDLGIERPFTLFSLPINSPLMRGGTTVLSSPSIPVHWVCRNVVDRWIDIDSAVVISKEGNRCAGNCVVGVVHLLAVRGIGNFYRDDRVVSCAVPTMNIVRPSMSVLSVQWMLITLLRLLPTRFVTIACFCRADPDELFRSAQVRLVRLVVVCFAGSPPSPCGLRALRRGPRYMFHTSNHCMPSRLRDHPSLQDRWQGEVPAHSCLRNGTEGTGLQRAHCGLDLVFAQGPAIEQIARTSLPKVLETPDRQ